MAVFNYSFDEIKEPESIGLIQEQLDTENLVSIDHNNILWIELQPCGICITYHPDNFKTSLLIKDSNGNKIAQEDSGLWIPDMKAINNAIDIEGAQVWIDNHSIESMIESNKNKITVSYYNVQGL